MPLSTHTCPQHKHPLAVELGMEAGSQPVSQWVRPHSEARKSSANTHIHAQTHICTHTSTRTRLLNFKLCHFHSKVTEFVSNPKVLKMPS